MDSLVAKSLNPVTNGKLDAQWVTPTLYTKHSEQHTKQSKLICDSLLHLLCALHNGLSVVVGRPVMYIFSIASLKQP